MSTENKGKKWWIKPLNILFFLMLVTAVRGLIIQYRDYRQIKGALVQKEAELKEAEARNERLKNKLAEAQDPEFIETQIFNKLGLVRKGSDLIAKLKKDEPLIDLRMSEDPASLIPNWQKWQELFF